MSKPFLTRMKAMMPVATLALIFLASCEPDKPAKKIDPAQAQTVAEPVFRREGSLEFVTSGGERHSIDIEIADNDGDRATGLMYRKTMAPNHGMLFIFETEGPQSFWMKNTFLPLDIIYVDANMRIVSIAENTKPFSESGIPSAGPAQYVVEVNAGYCRQKGIKAGDSISYKVGG